MGQGQGARKSDAGDAPELRGRAAEEGSYEGNARHVIKVICGLLHNRCPEKTAPALFLALLARAHVLVPDQKLSDVSLRLAMAQDSGARESVATSSDSPEPTP